MKIGKNPNSRNGFKKGVEHPRYTGGLSNSERTKRIRNCLIALLGGKCIHCGFLDIRALQIDHINGGGSKERKQKGFSNSATFYKKAIGSIEQNENKYQLLCANCNWIKRSINKENK